MSKAAVSLGTTIQKGIVDLTIASQTITARIDVQQIAAQLSFSAIGATIAFVAITANVAYTRLGIRDIVAIVLPNYGAALNTETLNRSTLG